jgi:arylsulfatase A-like enzyme
MVSPRHCRVPAGSESAVRCNGSWRTRLFAVAASGIALAAGRGGASARTAPAAETASAIQDAAGIRAGLCVHIGCGDDGTDRSPWLLGKAKPADDEAVFMVLNDYRGPTPGPWRGVRTAQHNFARTEEGPFLLTDVRRDPWEMDNLVKKEPELVRKLDEMTLAMIKKYEDRWPAKKE